MACYSCCRNTSWKMFYSLSPPMKSWALVKKRGWFWTHGAQLGKWAPVSHNSGVIWGALSYPYPLILALGAICYQIKNYPYFPWLDFSRLLDYSFGYLKEKHCSKNETLAIFSGSNHGRLGLTVRQMALSSMLSAVRQWIAIFSCH